MMKVGKLNRRISLQRYTIVTNRLNEQEQIWNVFAEVWASKQDISDSERIASQQIQATITTRFQIRYNALVSSLNAKDRVVFEGRIYDISAVKEIGRKEGIEISAVARTDG